MGNCSSNNRLRFNASAKNMMKYKGKALEQKGGTVEVRKTHSKKKTDSSSENGIETRGLSL